MKIVVVGAAGVVGQYVRAALEGPEVKIITAGRKAGDLRFDLTEDSSIRAAFDQIDKFDAVVSAAGEVVSKDLASLTKEDWLESLNSKLLGQIRLAQLAVAYLNDRGSITLTTGITSDEPVPRGITKTTVNRALEGFVMAAANELPRGIRINVVSPGLLEDSAPAIGHLFAGYTPVSGARVGAEYRKAVFGIQTGKTFRVHV